MCLPDFIEFKQIEESNPLIGYRIWRNIIKDSNILISQYQNYNWDILEGPHTVVGEDSGIYAYYDYNNYYNYNYNYNYYDYNNYYNYNYNYNYYNYNIGGIISQWGKTAIHKTGQRSEYAKVDTIFSIRLSDAKGPKEFLDWIEIFNKRIGEIADKYECKIVTWQDFKDSQEQSTK